MKFRQAFMYLAASFAATLAAAAAVTLFLASIPQWGVWVALAAYVLAIITIAARRISDDT